MSYFETTNFRLDDSPSIDAFGRLRVSNPQGIFDSQFTYGKRAGLWEDLTTGAGSAIAANANARTVTLTITTANPAYAIRQTYDYMRYQPGKSQMILMTGVIGAIKANTIQRIGYFDDDDGLFFEQDGTNLKVVRRTSVAAGPGTPVDNAVIQSAWNLDTMDGTGPSGVTIDTSKTNIFLIDFEALYVGRIRFGFVLDGLPVYCHEINNANSLTVPYMGTANLPLRYELRGAGAAGTTTMEQICCSVLSEGGQEFERAIAHTAARTSAIAASAGTPECVVAIRPSQDFPNGSGVANRTKVILKSISAYATTNPAYLQLVYGATITGGSWASVGTNSSVEKNITATDITGGQAVWTGFIAAASKTESSIEANIVAQLPFALNYAGTDQSKGWALLADSLSGTSNVSGALNWDEIH